MNASNYRLGKTLKQLAAAIIVLIAAALGWDQVGNQVPDTGDGHAVIASAFAERRSDVQVAATATVRKILRDDNVGSRHQKMILELPTGQTLLLSHNIDLAPRVAGVREGDQLAFYGEYEWSEQGGVIHWTHHDPAGRHADGWIKHNGNTYQ